MKRFWRNVGQKYFCTIIIFFVAILLTGCARQPRPPRTLMLSAQSDVSWLDPAKAYDTSSIPFVRILYRGLVDYGDGANIVPAVATRWTISSDGKTYTFYLRKDARFQFDQNGNQPGRRVTAEDFRYSIERILDPATASDGMTFYYNIVGAQKWSEERSKPSTKVLSDHVPGIVVPNDDEIIFHLNHPDATFLNYLAMPFVYAVPHDWVEKLDRAGETLNEHPNGCGPFQMKEWIHDRKLELVKNRYYYDPALPKCDRILDTFGGDDVLHLMRFELGDIDVQNLEDAAPPDFTRMTDSAKWQPYTQHAPMMDIRYVALNCEMKPFNNKLVRQAMNYAIDKSTFTRFLGKRIEVAHGVLPPGTPGYNPQLKGYDYDPQKAKVLLKQAGYPNGFTVTLWYSPTAVEWYGKAAQLIQANLKEVGVTVNLKAVTYAELKTAAGKRHNIQMSLMGWLQDFPDPSDFLDVLFNGEKITDTSSNNRAFYNNPQVNKLLDAAGIETNRAKRLKMYQQAEKIIVDEAPWIFLLHTERYVVHQPWIKGYKLHPMWSARYEYVEVKRQVE
jgi:ABC-type transport system substrate-binding protein